MPTIGFPRWPAALLLVSLPLLLGWLHAPAATAAHHEGPCTDATGVTVVVDHQDLGGGVVVRCATDFPAGGGTGLLALQLAGFAPSGTIKDGAGFVCRINNRPAADEDLVLGGQGYRENCIATPPDGAFWSYWHAPAGGDWTFSQLGAARSVEPGGYEGWSFSLGHDKGSNPAPGVRPAGRPEPKPSPPAPTPVPPVPAPTTPQPVTTAPPPAGAGTAPATSSTPPRSSAAPTTSAPVATTPRTSSPMTQTTPTATVSTSATTGTTAATRTTAGATPTTTTPPATGSAVPTSRPPQPTATEAGPSAPAEPTPPSDGPGIGTFVGVGAVASLAAAGGVIWWRRRSAL